MEYNETEAHELAESMGMAVYHVYLLKKGPTWSPEASPEIETLQEAHLANLRRLAEMGKLVLNGQGGSPGLRATCLDGGEEFSSLS
jgi:hypothetical protein